MLADTRMRGMEGGGLRDEVIGGTSVARNDVLLIDF